MSAVPVAPPLLLMTPGPTRVPERVLAAGARPMIHHRSPAFSAELAALVEMMGPVFGARDAVLPVHTTGRGAMEASLCNLFSAGDEIAIACNGKFGELWARMSESYGMAVHRFATDWARDVEVAELDQLLRDHPKTRAVALAYCETSTGVRTDIAALAKVARASGALVLVDGVSAIGGVPFAFDEWDVDVAVTASQKCLMASPGLAFVAMSARAWAASETARLPRNYWNFADIRRTITAAKPETPGTSPVHLVLQVTESLRLMHEEGLANVYARHEALGAATRAGIAKLGLALQCPAFRQFSPTLTAISLPGRVAPKPLREAIKSRGIQTAAGLGPYEPTSFRIGHMGDIRLADVERTLAAVGEALQAT